MPVDALPNGYGLATVMVPVAAFRAIVGMSGSDPDANTRLTNTNIDLRERRRGSNQHGRRSGNPDSNFPHRIPPYVVAGQRSDEQVVPNFHRCGALLSGR